METLRVGGEQRRHLTVADLAARLDVSARRLSSVEQGGQPPSPISMRKRAG
ncbi:helix-turn-helix domain-containing protein [Amycolatopsis thermoflava]|uniref:helix-turn-helix domain-containing protein n=1 Tax=Amycolatopsis thermoflava TaxID=84480 RepID=UPI003654AC4E